MQLVRVFTATAMAIAAFSAAGCGEGTDAGSGDVGDVAVVQGDLAQAIDSTGVCAATNVFRRACSRRAYPRSTLDPTFDPRAPATVTFGGGTRVELTVLRDRPGRKPEVVWSDEEQCADSVCLHATRLDRRVSGWLQAGAFVRVVLFGRDHRGFELALASH